MFAYRCPVLLLAVLLCFPFVKCLNHQRCHLKMYVCLSFSLFIVDFVSTFLFWSLYAGGDGGGSGGGDGGGGGGLLLLNNIPPWGTVYAEIELLSLKLQCYQHSSFWTLKQVTIHSSHVLATACKSGLLSLFLKSLSVASTNASRLCRKFARSCGVQFCLPSKKKKAFLSSNCCVFWSSYWMLDVIFNSECFFFFFFSE